MLTANCSMFREKVVPRSMLTAPCSLLHARKGVTMVELMVSMAILGVLVFVATTVLIGRKSFSELDTATRQMTALLRDAQSRSIAQSSSTSWGVHFENSSGSTPFYSLFASSYSTSTRENYASLPVSVGYVSSSIAIGSSTDIVFNQMTGSVATSASVRIYLLSNPAASSTISVSASGLVDWSMSTSSIASASDLSVPSVTTLAATAVSTSTAVLNGSVNPNGKSTTAWFDWGTAVSFGTSTLSADMGSGSAAVSASASISGLISGTTYYFRISAQSSGGTAEGSTLSLSTLGIISPASGEHYAWSDNFGWIDFGDPGNVTVSSAQLTGYASSSRGYVLLDCATTSGGDICGTSNFKVSNTSGGVLSGYAWNDTGGWISFNCSDPGICGTSNYAVTISATGTFSGYAWNDNFGWISFNCADPGVCATSNYKVQTTWTH